MRAELQNSSGCPNLFDATALRRFGDGVLAKRPGINDLLFLMNDRPPRGRGSAENPSNRFHKLNMEPDLEDVPEEDRSDPATEFLKASTKTILTRNDSPDVGFTQSVNPYMGCEHGTYFHFLHYLGGTC